MKKIFLFAVFFACSAINSDVLLWQINDSAAVDGQSNLYHFLNANYADVELGVRIASYDANGNFIKYLNPVYHLEDGTTMIDWEYNDQMIGTGNDIWDTRASQAYSSYSKELMLEQLFMMEIGIYDDDYSFSPFLWTNGIKVDGKHIYVIGGLDPISQDWIPADFYTVKPAIPSSQVPEPDILLLFLVGVSFLALRRRMP